MALQLQLQLRLPLPLQLHYTRLTRLQLLLHYATLNYTTPACTTPTATATTPTATQPQLQLQLHLQLQLQLHYTRLGFNYPTLRHTLLDYTALQLQLQLQLRYSYNYSKKYNYNYNCTTPGYNYTTLHCTHRPTGPLSPVERCLEIVGGQILFRVGEMHPCWLVESSSLSGYLCIYIYTYHTTQR